MLAVARETRLRGAMSLSKSELESLLCSPSRLRTLTDEGLIAALRSGCNDALAVLFERHSAAVLRRARAIFQDDSAAEDVVREVFLDAFRAVNQFNLDSGSFRIRLLQYVYQRAMNRWEHLQESELKELHFLEDEIIKKSVGKTLKDIRLQKGLSIDKAVEGVQSANINPKHLSRALGHAIKQSREERRMSRGELSRKAGFPR